MPSLDRCGLASLDDFDAPGYSALFEACERSQSTFLARRSEFFGDDYPWERDALHQWSRCWEYPYHLLHLSPLLQTGVTPTIADFGSGVTFFPFHLAQTGAHVVCVDHDDVVVRDVMRAAATFELADRLEIRKNTGVTIPAVDAEFEAVYSVSVLEHIAQPERIVEEIARVLKPGGAFIVTLDVDLKGDAQIDPLHFEAFLLQCNRYFERSVPEQTVHPLRVLTCYSGPYAREHQRQVPGLMLREQSGRLRPLIGGPIAGDLVNLACYGAAFLRKVQ